MMLASMRCSVVAIVLVQAHVGPDASEQLPPRGLSILLAPLSSPLLPEPDQHGETVLTEASHRGLRLKVSGIKDSGWS